MKHLFGWWCALSLFLGAAGCDRPAEVTNVMDNADQSAVDQYEASIAEEDAGMNANPPTPEAAVTAQ